jgi:hypothetical protein
MPGEMASGRPAVAALWCQWIALKGLRLRCECQAGAHGKGERAAGNRQPQDAGAAACERVREWKGRNSR